MLPPCVVLIVATHFLANSVKFCLIQAQPAVLCKLVGVPKLLDDIRVHYSTPQPDSPLTLAECREIRQSLLAVARLLLRHSVKPGNCTAKQSWAQVQVTSLEVFFKGSGFRVPSSALCSCTCRKAVAFNLSWLDIHDHFHLLIDYRVIPGCPLVKC